MHDRCALTLSLALSQAGVHPPCKAVRAMQEQRRRGRKKAPPITFEGVSCPEELERLSRYGRACVAKCLYMRYTPCTTAGSRKAVKPPKSVASAEESGCVGLIFADITSRPSTRRLFQEADLLDRVNKLQRMNFDLQEELTQAKLQLAAKTPVVQPLRHETSPTSATSTLTHVPPVSTPSTHKPIPLPSLDSDAHSKFVMDALQHLAKQHHQQQSVAMPSIVGTNVHDPLALLASLGGMVANRPTSSSLSDASLMQLKHELHAAMTAVGLLNC